MREKENRPPRRPKGKQAEVKRDTYRSPSISRYGNIVDLTRSVGVGNPDGIIGSSDVT